LQSSSRFFCPQEKNERLGASLLSRQCPWWLSAMGGGCFRMLTLGARFQVLPFYFFPQKSAYYLSLGMLEEGYIYISTIFSKNHQDPRNKEPL